MSDIQVQIIVHPDNHAHIEQCLISLKDEPVTLESWKSSVRLTDRLDFIDAATAPFVSFVGDSDAVIPGIYEKLLNAVTEETVGVHSHEAKIGGADLFTPHNKQFHLLTSTSFYFPRAFILKTDVAQEVSKFLRQQPAQTVKYLYLDYTILALASLCGDWVEVPEVGYLVRPQAPSTLPHSWYRSTTKQLLRDAAVAFKATI